MNFNCFAAARPTAGVVSGFIESFILTRLFLAFSPFLTLVDVLTDIFATAEFASPPDGGATEKWWTAWSVLFLYVAFRAGLMRYFEYKYKAVPLTFTNLMILIVPFMLNYKFKTNTRATVVKKEIAILLFFPFYPFLLLEEITGLACRTWRQTGNGQGIPVAVTELAVLEIIESLCQFSLQSRAYSLRKLLPMTYFFSGGFSLFSILRAIYSYWSIYLDIKFGPPDDGVWDCSDQGLKILPQCLSAISVKTVILDDNNLENVTEGSWNTFFEAFPNLTFLSLKRCYLCQRGAVALGAALKRNRGLVRINLRQNKINNIGAKALAAGLSASPTLEYLDLQSNHIYDGAQLFNKVTRKEFRCVKLDEIFVILDDTIKPHIDGGQACQLDLPESVN